MKIDPKEMTELRTAAQAAPRLDLYVGIHKALRACMTDALLSVGRMDPDDENDVTQTSQRVLALLDFCAAHLRHENDFVHTAIEARAPGGSTAVAHEHQEHEQTITELREMVAELNGRHGTECASAALSLYRRLALFIAHNFQHMHTEETALTTVLWARYTDAELEGIHQALVGSIPPAEMMRELRWIVPFINPAERTAMLSDMQRNAPAPAFAAVIDMVRPHLKDPEWLKLARSLALPPVPELVGYQ